MVKDMDRRSSGLC